MAANNLGSVKLDILMGMHGSAYPASLIGTIEVPLLVGIKRDGDQHVAVLTLPDGFGQAIAEAVEGLSARLNGD